MKLQRLSNVIGRKNYERYLKGPYLSFDHLIRHSLNIGDHYHIDDIIYKHLVYDEINNEYIRFYYYSPKGHETKVIPNNNYKIINAKYPIQSDNIMDLLIHYINTGESGNKILEEIYNK